MKASDILRKYLPASALLARHASQATGTATVTGRNSTRREALRLLGLREGDLPGWNLDVVPINQDSQSIVEAWRERDGLGQLVTIDPWIGHQAIAMAESPGGDWKHVKTLELPVQYPGWPVSRAAISLLSMLDTWKPSWKSARQEASRNVAGSRAHPGGDPWSIADDWSDHVFAVGDVEEPVDADDDTRQWGRERGLVHLGTGSTRSAFLHPRGVLKLPWDNGRDNAEEAGAWKKAGRQLRKILVPVIDADPDGSWLLMERAQPLGPPYKIPARLREAAFACGIGDVHAANVTGDGRLLDYAYIVSKDRLASCGNGTMSR